MTDREKAIVMAYTGICMLEGEKLDVYYQYLAGLYDRPVYTHEIFPLEAEIKEKSKPDFLELCKEVEPERKTGWWIKDDYYSLPYVCSSCGKRGRNDWNYCPHCGTKMEDKK